MSLIIHLKEDELSKVADYIMTIQRTNIRWSFLIIQDDLYNQCFYVDLEFKIRRYVGIINGKQKRWTLYDVNNNQIRFSIKQFLESWPQFRNDFYPDEE